MQPRHFGLPVALLLLFATAAAGITPRAAYPTPPPDQGTWILTVEIDSSGARALIATRKPKLDWRAHRDAAELPFGWQLRGADGALLAEGGFDAGELCLDPDHADEPPHIHGDECIPHVAHQNVKIPALAAAKTLEITRRQDDGTVPFGTVTLDLVATR